MPARPIRNRIIPYKILGHLLFAPQEPESWLESISNDEVRVNNGKAAREFRIPISRFKEALYWLQDWGLIESVNSERKRGYLVIKLKQPTNIIIEGSSNG